MAKPILKREITDKAIADAENAFKAIENSVMSGKLLLLNPNTEDIIVPFEGRIPRIGPSGTANAIDWHYHDLDDISKFKEIPNGKHRKVWTRRDLEDYAYSKPNSMKKIKEFIFQRRELLCTFEMNDEFYDNYKVINVEPEKRQILGKKMIELGEKEAKAQNPLTEESNDKKFHIAPHKTLYEELVELQMKMDKEMEAKAIASDYKLACLLQKEEEQANLIALRSNDDKEQSKSHSHNIHSEIIKDDKTIHKEAAIREKSKMDAHIDIKDITPQHHGSDIEEAESSRRTKQKKRQLEETADDDADKEPRSTRRRNRRKTNKK